MIELAVNVVAPTVVLLFGSDEAYLGTLWGLIAALAFPLAHSAYTMASAGKISPLAAIAVVSVLLTGGIGLLELPVAWFAWKEALFPALFGVASVLSVRTRFPLLPTLLASALDNDKINRLLAQNEQVDAHDKALLKATWQMGAIFVATAGVTFFFARYMVVSATGTEAFNTELGRYTAMSFPFLGVPSTALLLYIVHGVLLGIETRTGVEIDEVLR